MTNEFPISPQADLTYSNFTYALEGSSIDQLESVMTEKEKLLKEEVCRHCPLCAARFSSALDCLASSGHDRECIRSGRYVHRAFQVQA